MTAHDTAFDAGYSKFSKFVAAHDLIPDDRSRLVVAYSGGKDASLLADYLLEHKKRVRPDITVELITAVFPRFIYDSQDPDRRAEVQRAYKYWESRGAVHTKIDAGEDYPDSLLDGDNPCRKCALTIKPALLAKEMSREKYENAVYCVGLTLDDIVGWFVEALLVSAGRGGIEQIAKENPALHAALMPIAVRLFCRLEAETNKLLYARPLMDFSDAEIRAIVAERNLPLIPEDCREVQKRDDFVDSPRRDISRALVAVRSKYPVDSPLGRGTVYSSYARATDFFERSGLLPDADARQRHIFELLKAARSR